MANPQIEKLDEYWAAVLGCAVGDLYKEGVQVRPHPTSLSDYNGVFLFQREGQGCLVSMPPSVLTDELKAEYESDPTEVVFDPAYLDDCFEVGLDNIIGPAWIGYIEPANFKPVNTTSVRLLTAADLPALNALQKLCDPTDWEHSAINFEHNPAVYGYFAESQLVAVGTLDPWGEGIANLGLITDPESRGHGYARAVASAMTAELLKTGKMAAYRTLLSNTPSLTLARALGYTNYASTISVRLGKPA